MPPNNKAQDMSQVQIEWREWPNGPMFCEHGIELHDSDADALGKKERLVAFVDGFGWLHGATHIVVYYIKPSECGLTDQEFTDMKVSVEESIRTKRTLVPLWQVTARIRAVPNC